MKKNIFLSLFFLCFLANDALAKISLDNYVLTDDHVAVLKGYLYDLTRKNSVKPQNLKSFLPNIVDAVSWLGKRHNSNQVYKLKEIKNHSSVIIQNATSNINNFISGKFPPHLVRAAMANWNDLGLRVVIEHTKNSSKFKLRPIKQNMTRHLVYEYDKSGTN